PPPMTRQETPSHPGVALDSIDPNHGPVTGGTTLTVYGKGFHPFTVARIGGRDATTNFKSVDTLQVITPPGKAPAFADVLVMNPDTRTSVLRNGYRYDPVPPPSITTVDPKSGGVVGGTKITVVGANFTSRSIVTMGGARPVSTTFVDQGHIEIVSPARTEPGLVDVVITNADEQTASAKNVFRYDPVPAPSIESVLPKGGPVAGGSTITILGKNFGPRTIVEIGGHVVRAMTYVDARTLEAVTPPGESKLLVDVRVRNPDGQSAAVPRAFQYE
ncbi:MAG: IPT/TIG domain-containing protein, partial [Polyangiales bacterium]